MQKKSELQVKNDEKKLALLGEIAKYFKYFSFEETKEDSDFWNNLEINESLRKRAVNYFLSRAKNKIITRLAKLFPRAEIISLKNKLGEERLNVREDELAYLLRFLLSKLPPAELLQRDFNQLKQVSKKSYAGLAFLIESVANKNSPTDETKLKLLLLIVGVLQFFEKNKGEDDCENISKVYDAVIRKFEFNKSNSNEILTEFAQGLFLLELFQLCTVYDVNENNFLKKLEQFLLDIKFPFSESVLEKLFYYQNIFQNLYRQALFPLSEESEDAAYLEMFSLIFSDYFFIFPEWKALAETVNKVSSLTQKRKHPEGGFKEIGNTLKKPYTSTMVISELNRQKGNVEKEGETSKAGGLEEQENIKPLPNFNSTAQDNSLHEDKYLTPDLPKPKPISI